MITNTKPLSLSLALCVGAAGGCANGASGSPPPPTTTAATSVAPPPTAPLPSARPPVSAEPPKPRYGAIMVEIGQRFELAGRAMLANRFELAEFEVGELEELFEDDLPQAALPKKGNPQGLPGLADAFRATQIPALAKAARARDKKAFDLAFKQAADVCNGCHDTSSHRFIQIADSPGKGILALDPLKGP